MIETNGNSQGQDVHTSTPVTAMTSSTIDSTTPSPSIASEEKVFKQQELNDIVRREKQEAVERYKRSNEGTKPAQSQPLHQQHLEQISSEDSIRRMAAEEAQRLRNEWVQEAQRTAQEQEAQRITYDFLTKLNTGKEKYADFDQVLGDFEFGSIPHVVQMATLVDNTADVMYDLVKNPTKIASIQQLIAINPKLAYSEMQRLSKSIKDNENVANVKMPNAPLSQMRPSNTGTDSGVMTVSDYRKKYKA